jgi:hypothetical protein
MRVLQRLLDTLGGAGVAGIGLALFCIAFYASTLTPAQHELERRSTAGERPRNRLPAQRVADGDPALELARFYAFFPPAEALTKELERLYAHARASELHLQEGEYRLEPRASGLTTYRVTLPVRGTYAQVRKFVGRVLQDMPTASLDTLRFERKRPAEAQLDAQLRFTLYLRPPADKKGT